MWLHRTARARPSSSVCTATRKRGVLPKHLPDALLAEPLLGPRPIFRGAPASALPRRTGPCASPHHSAGRSAGGLAILDGHFAVHDDVTHTRTQLVRFRVGCMI